MTRVKRGIVVKKRHKRLLKQTKGYWGQRANIFKRAKQTLMRALVFAYKGRKMRKRDMRSLFITRINAAVVACGGSYSRFIHALKQANIELNRKMLAQLAVHDEAAFKAVVERAGISA
jgi:large subunit ribosomal protein L20